MTFTVRITDREMSELRAALFRSDGEEHAAFLYVGVAANGDDGVLLVRRVVVVQDSDFGVPSGAFNYRIAARAVAHAARECGEEGLSLVWVHSHPLADEQVSFSVQDHATI